MTFEAPALQDERRKASDARFPTWVTKVGASKRETQALSVRLALFLRVNYVVLGTEF